MHPEQGHFAHPVALVDVESGGLHIDKREWQIGNERVWRDRGMHA
jgi:hypothetical protein